MVVEFINEDSWYVFSHVNFIFNCVSSDKKADDSCIYENWDEYKLFQAQVATSISNWVYSIIRKGGSWECSLLRFPLLVSLSLGNSLESGA